VSVLTPDAERSPATRLTQHGAASLSDAELVALVLDAAGDLAPARALLADASLVALVRRAVAQPATAALRRIAAAVELVQRATAALQRPRQYVDVQQLASALVRRHAFDVQECLGVVLLDARDRFLTAHRLFLGTHRSALVSAREIVRDALAHAAAGVIIYHNHPSGDPTPSADDDRFTCRLETVTEAMDLTVVDHLILGAQGAYSYRDAGVLKPR